MPKKLPRWMLTLLTAYLVLSAIFIVYSAWKALSENYYESAFMEGRTYTVNEILKQANDGTCQPFTVFNETQSTELVKTNCTPPSTQSPNP